MRRPGLWATAEALYTQFLGLVLDVDPAELPPWAASDCQNVDLYGGEIRLRRGKSAYNASAPAAAKVLGLHDYYPAAAAMIPLMALADGKVYADSNSDGDFADANEIIATGLNVAAAFCEFIQYRDKLVYINNGKNVPLKWDGSTPTVAAAAVTAMTAPGAVSLVRVLYEIDNGEGSWTNGTLVTNVTANLDVDDYFAGAGSTRFEASGGSVGRNFHKSFSAGTQDLSAHRWLQVAAKATWRRDAFKIALKDAGGNVSYDGWDTFNPSSSRQWQKFYVPLDPLAPADRTACPGFGFFWAARPVPSDFPQSIWIDNVIPIADLPADEYTYSATFYNPTAKTESGPGASVKLTISNPLSGVAVAAPRVGADAGVTRVFLYRIRRTGFWRFPRKVGETAYLNGVTASAIASTATTSVTVSSGTNIANGNLLRIDSELLKVTAGGGTTTLTVARGWGSSIAATHLAGALVYLVLFDARSDGDVDIAAAQGVGGTDGTDGQELRTSLVAPPISQTMAIVGNRLFCGGVTLSGTYYPYRVYVSRQDHPEEFSSVEIPEDPGVAGWFDLPTRDRILRIIEHDGNAIIFTDRSVYTCDGSGFDDYVVAQRAFVGLVAREAVCVSDRLIYFLSEDGVRVLAPNRGSNQPFDTWPISEPVRSRLQAIPYAYRSNCALGVDDLGRVHLSLVRSGQTTPDAALVFDPRVPGALTPGYQPVRPGWTYYTSWGFSCSKTLRNGANGESGGQLVGDPTTGKLWRLGINQFGLDQNPESGGVPWFWQSRAEDTGAGLQRSVLDLSFETGVSNSQKVRLTLLVGGVAGAGYVGSDALPRVRLPSSARGRRLQVRLDSADPASTDEAVGSLANHVLPYTVRSVGMGLRPPLARVK